MKGPEFTVIMPAYNASAYIEEAINSVLNQTFDDFELLIIDDGSTDDTRVIVEGFCDADERVIYIKNSMNLGVSGARNIGIERSRGRYIAFLDSDDTWLPNKLERQRKAFHDTLAIIVYGSYFRVDSSGRIVGMRRSVPRCNYSDLLWRNHIGNLTACYDARALSCVRFKNVKHEDYSFWLQALRLSGGFAIGLVEPVGKYRITANSLSANKFAAIAWTWRIFYSVERVGFVCSVLYTLSQVSGALRARVKDWLSLSRE